MSTHDNDDDAGYGRPPRKNQFRKGQSGNPAGRPRGRKTASEPARVPGLHPTREVIRKEAARLVTIRDGTERHEITTREAVIRSLGVKAMQGGVMATRTYLQLTMAEEERVAEKKEKSYKFWDDYIEKHRALISEAERRGETLPDPVPHPDDIKLDIITREVQIIGPAYDEEVPVFARRRARFETCYELMVYFYETINPLPTEERPVFGPFMLMLLSELSMLPKRMRGISDEFQNAITLRATGPEALWDDYLTRKCEELQLPFVAGRRRVGTVDIRQTGHEYINGRIVPRAPKKRGRRRS